MNKMIWWCIAAVVFAFALQGCGGGGGAAPAAVTNAVAQGVWSGSSSTNGYSLQTLILEDGTIYNIFGTLGGNGVFTVAGFDQGSTTETGSALSGSISEYWYTGATSTATLSGNIVTNTSINGTATYPGGTTSTFSLTPVTSSSYVYGNAASTADVVGTWNGNLLNGNPATIVVAANGSFTGADSVACNFTGTVTPRPSGKNVFNVSVTFGNAPCALPNQTATGVAIDYIATNGLRQLLVAVQNASKANGTMFIAQR
jgi:hypothetical protein